MVVNTSTEPKQLAKTENYNTKLSAQKLNVRLQAIGYKQYFMSHCRQELNLKLVEAFLTIAD